MSRLVSQSNTLATQVSVLLARQLVPLQVQDLLLVCSWCINPHPSINTLVWNNILITYGCKIIHMKFIATFVSQGEGKITILVPKELHKEAKKIGLGKKLKIIAEELEL